MQVLYVSGFLVLSSLLGLIGAKLSDNAAGRGMIKVHGVMLLRLLLALVAVVVVGVYCQGRLELSVDENWVAIESRLADPFVMGSLARNVTREEFAELVQSSYGFIESLSGALIVFISVALVAARYAAANPMSSALSKAGGALMVGGAVGLGARMLNPMMGASGEEVSGEAGGED